MTKIRPVHIISGLCPTSGGPTFAIDGLVRAQHELGMHPKVVATYSKTDNLVIAKKLIEDGLDVKLLGPCYTHWRWFPGLQNELELSLKHSHVIHFHGVFEAIHYLSSKMGIPYVLRPCGLLSTRALSDKYLKKYIYLNTLGSSVLQKSSLLHCVSESEKLNLGIEYEPTKIVCVGNGYDFAKHPKLVKTQTSDRPYFLFLGRIHEIKRIDILINALAALPDRISLKIVGPDDTEGRLTKSLTKIAKTLNVQHRINFLGEIYGLEKDKLISEAICLALSSEHENFSNVVIEALANGTPVVLSSKVALAGEACANNIGQIAGFTGESFAKKILKYSELNNESRLLLSEKCTSFVISNYSWKTKALKWKSLYQSIS